jgi:hypothetical protein
MRGRCGVYQIDAGLLASPPGIINRVVELVALLPLLCGHVEIVEVRPNVYRCVPDGGGLPVPFDRCIDRIVGGCGRQGSGEDGSTNSAAGCNGISKRRRVGSTGGNGLSSVMMVAF